MKALQPGELLDASKLDPNDPDVYTNPSLMVLLTPVQQVIAMVNMAQTGQLVQGNPTLTLEAILERAGYPMVLDGNLSGEEMMSLENYKAKLNDDGFKETAMMMLDDFVTVVDGKQQLSIMSELLSPIIPALQPEGSAPTRGRTFQQGKTPGAKLISDPD